LTVILNGYQFWVDLWLHTCPKTQEVLNLKQLLVLSQIFNLSFLTVAAALIVRELRLIDYIISLEWP
jgi:hypothetical protein